MPRLTSRVKRSNIKNMAIIYHKKGNGWKSYSTGNNFTRYSRRSYLGRNKKAHTRYDVSRGSAKRGYILERIIDKYL